MSPAADRMRVAMITPRYAPDIGGVEQNAEHVARGMVAHGVAMDVLTTDPSGELPRREGRDGVRVLRFRTLGNDAVFFVSPSLIRWLGRHAGSYDLLHVHSYHTALATGVAFVSRLAGKPFVLTAHYHGGGHTPARQALHVAYRPVGNLMLRSAASIICQSSIERALLVRPAGRRAELTVVPPGIDVAEIRAAAPIPRGDGVVVLAVGRMEPYKQTSRLIEALPWLGPEFRAVVIGSGSARPAIEAAISDRGVGPRTLLLDPVSREDLFGWYRSADVFVSMSLHEAFGLTIGEAVAGGAAVVASDIPAHREVASFLPAGSITLVPPDASGPELAAVIEHAARHRSSSSDVSTIPTWDDTVAGTLEVYRSALRRFSSGPNARGPNPELR